MITHRTTSAGVAAAILFAFIFVISSYGQSSQSQKFLAIVKSRLIEENHLKAKQNEPLDEQVQKLCPFESRASARMILFQYGAAFTGTHDVLVPGRCVFLDEGDVQRFQAQTQRKSLLIGNTLIELQAAAMDALIDARSEAQAQGLDITPLDGSIAARRTYMDTVGIWYSRFDPAIKYWVATGKIPAAEGDSAKSLDIYSLIDKVSEWEKQGYLFGTGTLSSIFSSVAPPGTSQHLSMLALDVVEHKDPQVRLILAKHGWVQTIKGDMPHFTYLGIPESKLSSLGLQFIIYNDRGFWIPAPEVDPSAELAPSASVPLNVGDNVFRALVYKGKPSKTVMINVHDDENTAVEAAKNIVKINGGTLVELKHSGERLIAFSLDGKPYKIDPNRIFTLAGINKTLLEYSQTSAEAEAEVARFAQDLVSRFLTGADVVVALHNNSNNGFSAASYLKGGEFEKDGAQVFINPQRDIDDFFYVTEEKYFNALKARGFNVVLQNDQLVTDDGSLSVYCGRQKITYINVEAELGHQIEQENMLTALIDVIAKQSHLK